MSFEIHVISDYYHYRFVEFWPEKSLSFFGRLSFFGLEFFLKKACRITISRPQKSTYKGAVTQSWKGFLLFSQAPQ